MNRFNNGIIWSLISEKQYIRLKNQKVTRGMNIIWKELTKRNPVIITSVRQRTILELCVVFILLAITTPVFAFKAFHVSSGSMSPTLNVGDYFWAQPYARSDGKPSFTNIYQFFSTQKPPAPKRGDVVVFKRPKRNYVKRLIGMPGDKIQMIKGVLHINHKPVELVKGKEVTIPQIGKYTQYTETLPNGVHYHILDRVPSSVFDNTPEFRVPEKSYFVLGDNRDNSLDSRAKLQIGFISEESLIGYVPLNFLNQKAR